MNKKKYLKEMKQQSHDDFRASVCVGCHKPGCERKVKEGKLEKKVQEKIYSGFSLKDTSLPFGLCDGCRTALITDCSTVFSISYENKKVKRQDIVDGRCVCYICEAGRSKKKLKLKRKRGPKTGKQSPQNKKICGICKQVIGRGIPHPQPCRSSDGRKADNILSLAENNNVEQKIASSVIDKSAADKVRGEDISLKRNHGPPLKVRVSPRKREEEKKNKEEKKNVNHEAMNALKVTLNLSENKTLKAKRILSLALGSKKIQPKYREKNVEKNRKARSFLRN